ncbi:MAG: hypothetical protein O7D34_07500, partial [Ignavibacteria bacterium]|nr:hypothetical protein [Ignavibacteria bacterium]
PHCAAGTVMLAMLYRYNRKLFYPAVPVLISLYVATVYGRYHYTADGIAGILAAVFVLKFSPKFATGVRDVIELLKRLLASGQLRIRLQTREKRYQS